MSGIIVGMDGSGHSHRALDWAMHEAAIRHAPLTVITVSQALASAWGPIHFQEDPVVVERTRRTMEEAVEKAQAKLGDMSPASINIRIARGIPAEELISATRGADMVVVGSRGSGGFAKLLLGSVSTQIAHHAHCPVVVIPPEDRG